MERSPEDQETRRSDEDRRASNPEGRRMSPIPPPHPDCAKLIKITAPTTHNTPLPPKHHMNKFQRLKLQSANQNFEELRENQQQAVYHARASREHPTTPAPRSEL
jgi:hypothetical protein